MTDNASPADTSRTPGRKPPLVPAETALYGRDEDVEQLPQGVWGEINSSVSPGAGDVSPA